MKKLQHELDNVIRMEQRVEESDLPRLEYLEAVVKETLRLHPLTPLMVPHETTEACIVGGHYIPYKSRILVNLWAIIGRDPMHWKDVEKYMLERFVGSSMDEPSVEMANSWRWAATAICLSFVSALLMAETAHFHSHSHSHGLRRRSDIDNINSSEVESPRGNGQWCVANPSADRYSLRAALDYVCNAGADCSAIQPGHACYEPNTLVAHASYAFHSFWLKSKYDLGYSCDIKGAAGVAVITSTDPSYPDCTYPS
eukprot:Gb_28683 [translate_table: standard]